jgi:hypothetical protein
MSAEGLPLAQDPDAVDNRSVGGESVAVVHSDFNPVKRRYELSLRNDAHVVDVSGILQSHRCVTIVSDVPFTLCQAECELPPFIGINGLGEAVSNLTKYFDKRQVASPRFAGRGSDRHYCVQVIGQEVWAISQLLFSPLSDGAQIIILPMAADRKRQTKVINGKRRRE